MSSNLTTNKIAAAILCAGLIAIVTGKVTEFMYDGHLPEKGEKYEGPRGYKVDVVETADAGGAAAPATAGDISALYATADVKAGEDFVNKKCTVCHDVSKHGANKVGPHIYGVINRPIASIGDFNYSGAMKTHAGTAKTWSYDNLNAFLWSPAKTVPGTLMGFAGIPKDQDRANVIAYIGTKMTDSPAKFPAVTAKPAAAADKGAPTKNATPGKGSPAPEKAAPTAK